MDITFIKCNIPPFPQKMTYMPLPWAQTYVAALRSGGLFLFCRVLVPAPLALPGGTVGGEGGPGSPGTVGIGRGLCHVILRRLWGIHVITVPRDAGGEWGGTGF